MPSVDQLRNRLLKKLYELFQLDQPDLDFGFYRIMHAKAQEVQEFIEDDLLKIVANEFGEISEGHTAELQVEYEKAIQIAKSYGALKPEETEMVMNAKAKLDAAKDTADSEAGVYDHLYRFLSVTTIMATSFHAAITPEKTLARPHRSLCLITEKK